MAAAAPSVRVAGRAGEDQAAHGARSRRVVAADHLRALSMYAVAFHHFASCGMLDICFSRTPLGEAWAASPPMLPGGRPLLRVWPRVLLKMTFASFLYTAGYGARQRERKAAAAAAARRYVRGDSYSGAAIIADQGSTHCLLANSKLPIVTVL